MQMHSFGDLRMLYARAIWTSKGSLLVQTAIRVDWQCLLADQQVKTCPQLARLPVAKMLVLQNVADDFIRSACDTLQDGLLHHKVAKSCRRRRYQITDYVDVLV